MKFRRSNQSINIFFGETTLVSIFMAKVVLWTILILLILWIPHPVGDFTQTKIGQVTSFWISGGDTSSEEYDISYMIIISTDSPLPGTDRHNFLQMLKSDLNYPMPYEQTNFWDSVESVNYPSTPAMDLAIGYATSGYYCGMPMYY